LHNFFIFENQTVWHPIQEEESKEPHKMPDAGHDKNKRWTVYEKKDEVMVATIMNRSYKVETVPVIR
jgi:hypothetical protein